MIGAVAIDDEFVYGAGVSVGIVIGVLVLLTVVEFKPVGKVDVEVEVVE